MKPYATHLPILLDLFENFTFSKVLEFGCGVFSTPVFTKNCSKVLSIEMGDDDLWYRHILKELEGKENLILKYMKDPTGSLSLKEIEGNYDLIFIDGPTESRINCLQESVSKGLSDLIIAHDTEDFVYRWDKVVFPKGWFKIDIPIYYIHTTVYTSNMKYKEWAESLDLDSLRKKYYSETH